MVGYNVVEYMKDLKGQTLPPLLVEVLLKSGQTYYVKNAYCLKRSIERQSHVEMGAGTCLETQYAFAGAGLATYVAKEVGKVGIGIDIRHGADTRTCLGSHILRPRAHRPSDVPS